MRNRKKYLRIVREGGLGIFFAILLNFQIQANNTEERLRDSLELQKLSDLVWSLTEINPDSSFLLAQRVLKQARKEHYKKIEAYSLSDIGNYYRIKENFQLAEKYFNQSLEVRKELSDTIDIASGYNLLGILYTKQEKYDLALISFKKGLLWLSASSKKERLKIKIYDGIATVFLRQGSFKNAQNYISKSISQASELGDSVILAKCWQNQGVLYEHIGRSERALEFYNKAESYYKLKNNNNGLIDIYINKGAVYLHRKDFTEAIKLLLRAKELSVKSGLRDNLSSIYNNLGLAYQGAEQIQLAKQQFIAGIHLADSLNKPQRQIEAVLNLIRLEQEEENSTGVLELVEQYDSLIQTNGTFQHLVTFYEYHATVLGRLNNFEKAFEVKTKANHLKDSLNQIIDNAQLQAEEVERLRSEKEIAQKRSELKELSLQQKIYKQRYLLTLLGLLVVLFLATSIVFYFKRRNTKQRLKLVEAERKLLLKQEQAEKKVREEIGDELHDNMTKQLSLARIKMDGLINQLPDGLLKVKEEYEGIRELLNVYYRNVRRLSHKLVKELALGSHLEKRIEELLLDIQSSINISTHFSFDNLPEKLPEGFVDEIVAIVNLTTDNVIQHSEASELSVQVYREKGFLHLTIEDNGKGFNLNKSRSSGVGLAHLKKRTKRLNAELYIESSKGKGTLIVLQIPLKNA